MKRWQKKALALLLTGLLLMGNLAGCSTASEETDTDEKQDVTVNAPEIEGLTFESMVETEYAKGFQIFRYEGGYSAIRVSDGNDYLVVPEDGTVPENLPASCTVLKQPLNKTYLAATSAMNMMNSIGAVENIRLSGGEEGTWYTEEANEAMKRGDMLYAGKYSAPDYELLVAEKCNIAIESTMILHSPEVEEKLETMGIPMFIDRASYEAHPLGRTEWLKVYGELMNKKEEAQEAFDTQKAFVTSLDGTENTEKTVAFFYVNQNGTVIARKSSDYVPAMIEIAGGRYIFDNLGDPEKATSGVDLTMEEFYATAKDADYIIYNATIDNPLNSVDDLLAKSDLFADFKAVQEGRVWSTDKYLYQAADENGSIIQDIHTMLTDETAEKLSFLYKVSE